jgi:hypothetical protein
MTAIQIAHFWSRVQVTLPYKCWHWKGVKSPKGYGHLVVGGSKTMAHRVAYMLVNGEIPDGDIIRHTCDNPSCCNPKHLLTGSNADNMRDMVVRGRSASGTKNAQTKINEADALYIKTNPENLSGKALAEKFGLASSTISYIRNGRSWKYLVAPGGIEPPSSPCEGAVLPLN